MAQESIIIDIEINENDVKNKLGSVSKSIAELNTENAKLRKELREGTGDWVQNSAKLAENKAQIKQLTAEQKTLQNQLVIITKENKTYGDSLHEQRAALVALQNQYAGLTKAQRESVGGKEMLKSLQELDKQVKDTEASIGMFQRNVGNYEKALGGLSPTMQKVSGMFGVMGSSAKGAAGEVGTSLKAAGTAVVNFGKMLLTTPVGWLVLALTGLVAIIKKVVDAFKGNEEASNRMKESLSFLQPIINAITNALDFMAVAISKVINFLTGWIGKNNEAVQSARELVRAQSELEKAQREYTESSAKNNMDIAKLRAEALDKEKYSAAERLKMYKDAKDLAQENLENEKKIAAENLRLLELKLSQTKKITKEDKEALAQAKAEMYRVEENYYTNTKRLQNEYLKAQADIRKEAEDALAEKKKAYEDAQKKAEERAKKTIEAARGLEDEIVKLTKQGVELQIAEEEKNTRRRIEAIEERLKKEKDLTQKAREDLQASITAIQANSDKIVVELQEKAREDKIKKDIEAEQRRLSLLLEVATKGSEAELALRLQQIEILRQEELKQAELTAEEITAINTKYDLQYYEAKKQNIRKNEQEISLALQNELNERLLLVFNNEQAVAEIKLEEAERQLQYLQNLDEDAKAAMFESNEAYTAAVLESKRKIMEAEKNVMASSIKTAQMQMKAAQSLTNSLSELISGLAEDNEAMAGFTKALALFQIGANLAIGISEAIAAGAGQVFPMNLIAIASGVAAVVSAIVSAKQVLSEPPKAPKFAGGGIVPGTSTTGDKVPALLNSREMVLNLDQQRALFDNINSGIVGIGIDYERLAASFKEAAAEIPPNTLDLREWDIKQKQLVTIKEAQTI